MTRANDLQRRRLLVLLALLDDAGRSGPPHPLAHLVADRERLLRQRPRRPRRGAAQA